MREARTMNDDELAEAFREAVGMATWYEDDNWRLAEWWWLRADELWDEQCVRQGETA